MLSSSSPTIEVLKDICRAIGVLSLEVATAPLTIQRIRSRALHRHVLKASSRTRGALRQLQKSEFITIRKTKNGDRISLTNKGLAQALITCVEYHRNPLPENLVCLVLFDIPESERAARRATRQLLKKLGFRQLQQSVWCANHDAGAHIRLFVHLMKLKQWVRVFTATENDLSSKK